MQVNTDHKSANDLSTFPPSKTDTALKVLQVAATVLAVIATSAALGGVSLGVITVIQGVCITAFVISVICQGIIQSKKNQKKQTINDNDALKLHIADLNGQVQTKEAELVRITSELTAKLSSKEAEISQLKAQHESLKAEKNKLEVNLNELSENNGAKSQQITVLNGQIEETKQAIAKLTTQKDNEIIELGQNIEKIEGEKVELLAKLKTFEEANSALNEQVKSLQGRVKILEEKEANKPLPLPTVPPTSSTNLTSKATLITLAAGTAKAALVKPAEITAPVKRVESKKPIKPRDFDELIKVCAYADLEVIIGDLNALAKLLSTLEIVKEGDKIKLDKKALKFEVSNFALIRTITRTASIETVMEDLRLIYTAIECRIELLQDHKVSKELAIQTAKTLAQAMATTKTSLLKLESSYNDTKRKAFILETGDLAIKLIPKIANIVPLPEISESDDPEVSNASDDKSGSPVDSPRSNNAATSATSFVPPPPPPPLPGTSTTSETTSGGVMPPPPPPPPGMKSKPVQKVNAAEVKAKKIAELTAQLNEAQEQKKAAIAARQKAQDEEKALSKEKEAIFGGNLGKNLANLRNKKRRLADQIAALKRLEEGRDFFKQKITELDAALANNTPFVDMDGKEYKLQKEKETFKETFEQKALPLTEEEIKKLSSSIAMEQESVDKDSIHPKYGSLNDKQGAYDSLTERITKFQGEQRLQENNHNNIRKKIESLKESLAKLENPSRAASEPSVKTKAANAKADMLNELGAAQQEKAVHRALNEMMSQYGINPVSIK